MKISLDEIRHVSELARLSFSDEELEAFSGQLGEVLEYIHKLNQVDTEGVVPTSHVLDLVNVLREDEDAVSNAPDEEGSLFVVPRII